MTAWLFRFGLAVVLALSALSLWTLHDTQQPPAPAPGGRACDCPDYVSAEVTA